MARTAINMMLTQPARAPQEVIETRLAELESRLHLLSLEVKRLNQHSGHSLTPDVSIPVRTT